jgi:hypothetical protein
MAPTKQNEGIVWKYFFKEDKFMAKCEYCKNEIRSRGNTTNWKVRFEWCKFSPSRKYSLTKKNNKLGKLNKETNNSNTDNGDKNMEVEFKDDSDIVSMSY